MPYPIAVDAEGYPTASQETHVKTYSYSTTNKADIVHQKDTKGNGIRYFYKKGTSILLKKYIGHKETEKRWFYDYNEDGVLIQISLDDGEEIDTKFTPDVYERHLTQITPKSDLPNIGAPEVIEEKYLDFKSKKELLLKKIVNHFDTRGNICAQDFYDAHGEYRYTLKKDYENGLLTMESDPIGNETTYSYDANHNLISLTHSNAGISFEYRYDLKNRLIYTAEKDHQGNVFETQTSYDLAGFKRSSTDKFGHETLYYSDTLGRIQSVSYPETNPYTYRYDLFDHIISVTNPKGETTTTACTLRGQPTKIEYPDGTEERFKYDAEGSLHRHLSKDGTVKIFEYDYLGRVEHIEHYSRGNKTPGKWLSSIYYSYNAFHKISEKDEDSEQTTYTHDSVGRIASVRKDSKKTEFFYDALGRTTGIKKWKTANTFTLELKEYDLLNNMIEERLEDHQGNLLLKYKYIYNESSLLKKVVAYPQNQESIIKNYDYDGFGRLISIRDAFNQVTEIIYDDLYINELGQRVLKRTEIDPAGNKKEEIFDLIGHLAKITQKNKYGHILSESEFAYDKTGNQLLEKNAVIFSGEFLRTDTTEYTYGPNDKPTAIIHAPNSCQERITSLTYNAYGELSTKQESDDKSPITYQYSEEGKLESISYQEKNKEIIHKLSYDIKGNLEEIKLGSTHTILHYFDPNNQLTSERIEDKFGSYQIDYKLDGEGLIQSIQLPDRSFIKYDYSGPFVTKILRCTKDKKELYNHRILSRDLMGNILEEILTGHAGERTQDFDLSGRKTKISTDFFQDTIPKDGCDLLKNIKQREITLDDEKYTIEYEYDDLCHLISEKGEIQQSYTFDSLKNRLTKGNSSYQLNELNQLLEADGTIYTFDLNGNLSSKTLKDQTWTFQYNALNQLIFLQDPNQTTLTFTYDLSGRRLSKKVKIIGKKSKIFRYFYVGQTEIGALDEKGAIVELRIPSNPNSPEKTSFIAFELEKEIYVPIYDLQGNVSCLIDPDSRKIVESYQYSAFGERPNPLDSDIKNPWGYLGKRIDSESGLMYFGYRYYDPEIGRWISPDPAGNIDGPNLYAFCLNNPLTYTDYFGLASETNNTTVDEKYFYGEYEPHCFCERHRDCKRGGDIGSTTSNFPIISYNDSFETYFKDYRSPELFIKDCYDNSSCYDLSEQGLPDLPNDLAIGFINGIWNNLKNSKASAQYLSRLSGGHNIHAVYNATHGVDTDILECCLGLNYIATGPVRQLHKMWNNFFKKSSTTAKFLMICHSQGAIHVRNALLDYPSELRNRILVVAIAPAAYVYQETSARAIHYRAQTHRDFIPRLDVTGSNREHNTIFTLESDSHAPAFDHEFMSPTYQERLEKHIRSYILTQGGVF